MKGETYKLYVVIDVYSRYVVGWRLEQVECSVLAKELFVQSMEKQQANPGLNPLELIVHSDRGPAMKSKTVGDFYDLMGVSKSFSRPYVSNDNPFSESHFKTMKYGATYADRFGCFEDALLFCRKFFVEYNTQHQHKGIAYLCPEQVHYGSAPFVLQKRSEALLEAYKAHPERFPKGCPIPAKLPKEVWINPPGSQTSENADPNSSTPSFGCAF